MRRSATALLALAALAILAAGCQTSPRSEYRRNLLHEDVQRAIADFQQRDPEIDEFFETAHGYAIFPSIGKGGAGVGGAYGRGEVYEQGELIGYCDVYQGTVGLQLGGQSYSQLMFFRDADAMDAFTAGEYTPAAQASAIATRYGAATNASYSRGVVIFYSARGGLMYEASVGGQRFNFEPVGR